VHRSLNCYEFTLCLIDYAISQAWLNLQKFRLQTLRVVEAGGVLYVLSELLDLSVEVSDNVLHLGGGKELEAYSQGVIVQSLVFCFSEDLGVLLNRFQSRLQLTPFEKVDMFDDLCVGLLSFSFGYHGLGNLLGPRNLCKVSHRSALEVRLIILVATNRVRVGVIRLLTGRVIWLGMEVRNIWTRELWHILFFLFMIGEALAAELAGEVLVRGCLLTLTRCAIALKSSFGRLRWLNPHRCMDGL